MLYDGIYNSENYSEISLKEYLDRLADVILLPIYKTKHITVERHIEDIILPSKISFSLGIIINEILTNIVKHAFKGRDKGNVTISSSKKSAKVLIVIQDDGVGMPKNITLKTSTGFGLSLIKLMSESINGKIQVKRFNGTSFILEIPINTKSI